MTTTQHLQSYSTRYRTTDVRVEIQTPNETVVEHVPGNWVARDFGALRQILSALGYVESTPKGLAAIAFQPRSAHSPGDVAGPISEMTELLQLIPNAKISDIAVSETGLTAVLLNYRTGRKFHVVLSDIQRPLGA